MSRVETTILLLYAIAGLESFVRKRAHQATLGDVVGRPSKSSSASVPPSRPSDRRGAFSRYLRPLVPSYRFFDAIGRRLEVHLVPRDSSSGDSFLLDDRAARPFWSLFENSRENLWLHGESLVASLVEDGVSPSATDPRVLAVVARAREFLDLRSPRGSDYFVDLHVEGEFLLRVAEFRRTGAPKPP